MKKPLTARQTEVFNIIKVSLVISKVAPTIQELAKSLKVNSTRSVVKHLIALEKKGYIYRTSENRGIKLIEEKSNIFVQIPVLGYANAGTPLVIAEEEEIGTINISRNLISGSANNLFSVIIKGDSMNEKSINGVLLEDGNYAIIDHSDTEIRDNEAFLFIIDGAATIKCAERGNNLVTLYPKSSNLVHSPYYVDEGTEVFVNGRVVKCLKRPKS